MKLIEIQSSDSPLAKGDVVLEKLLSVNVSINLINQREGGLVDMKASKDKALTKEGRPCVIPRTDLIC